MDTISIYFSGSEDMLVYWLKNHQFFTKMIDQRASLWVKVVFVILLDQMSWNSKKETYNYWTFSTTISCILLKSWSLCSQGTCHMTWYFIMVKVNSYQLNTCLKKVTIVLLEPWVPPSSHALLVRGQTSQTFASRRNVTTVRRAGSASKEAQHQQPCVLLDTTVHDVSDDWLFVVTVNGSYASPVLSRSLV